MEKRTPSDTGNRIAIVIGCSVYASEGLSNLRFAEKDADAIAERLRNPEIGGYSDIYSFNSNSSLRDIEVTIDKVLAATRNNDKLEGPEFYLVHNQQRKQKTLKKWRDKINKMQDHTIICRRLSG